jgi:hypothetical protein
MIRAASTSLALVIPAVLASTSGSGVVLLVPLPSTGVVSVPELGAVTDPLATMPLEEPIVVPLPTLVEPDGLVPTVPLAAVAEPDAGEPETLVFEVPLEEPAFCERTALGLPHAATTTSAPLHVKPTVRRMSATPNEESYCEKADPPAQVGKPDIQNRCS